MTVSIEVDTIDCLGGEKEKRKKLSGFGKKGALLHLLAGASQSFQYSIVEN